jgi:dolichol-phosphate mannosyltransferase
VYGPYEEPNRLVPALIVHGWRGTLPPLTSPETARDFVFVHDVVDAYLLAASQSGSDPGAVYNVGSGTQTPLRTIVELARRELKIAAAPVWESMPSRVWDTNVWVADTRKIHRELGWCPRHTIDEGFRHTAEWLGADEKLRDLYEQRLRDAGATPSSAG